MDKKHIVKTGLPSYDISAAPAIRFGDPNDPGWLYSLASNEWEKFDNLADRPVVEEDFLVGKGFSVYYPRATRNNGTKVILKK